MDFLWKSWFFLLILIKKALKNLWGLVFFKKLKWLDNYWLNLDNLNALWQAIFQWVFCITQQPQRFCFDAVATHCMLLWLKPCRLSFNICISPQEKFQNFKLLKKMYFENRMFTFYWTKLFCICENGGSSLHSIFELQRIKILEPFQNFPYVKLLCCLHWWSYFDYINQILAMLVLPLL